MHHTSRFNQKQPPKRNPFCRRWYPGKTEAPKPRFRLSGLVFDLLLADVAGPIAEVQIREAANNATEANEAIQRFYQRGGRR
jgi:hypothetical protein